MQKNTKNTMSGKNKVALGMGAVALGAGVAGAYYLLGPKAKIHQKKVLALTAKMKKDLTAKAKKVKDMTEPLYKKTVDTLAATYGKQYKAHEKDIKAFAKKLKAEWKKVK
jgi:uncharacterized protein HemX